MSTLSWAVTDDTQILDKEKTPTEHISFRHFSSCESMDTVLTQYFKKALLEQITMYGGAQPMPLMEDVSSSTSSVAPGLDKVGMGWGGGEGGFSQTNVQIAGIDESEVVKTDGTYIYYASNQPDADGYQYVTITRAVPARDMSVVKRIKLPANYGNIQLYLADNKLTILANKWNQNYIYNPSPISVGNGSATVVVVYDMTNITSPRLERFYTVNGDLSQSRRDGDYLYVLSQNYVSLNVWGGSGGVYSKEDITSYVDKKFDPAVILPNAVDIHSTSDTSKQVSVKGKKIPYTLTKSPVRCSEVEYILPEKPQNLSFLTLSVIPLKNTNASVTRKVIYGDAAQFFMSKDSFYIVSNYWKQGGDFACPVNARCMMPMFRSEQNSLIHRFSTKSGVVNYEYSVLTPGIPLSQYALNEKNGILYTVNQKDWTTNGVDIFAIDGKWKLLSKLENVGAKERFQAARYIGNRLYLVTFEQVDPLFVIDTTDSKNMKIMGELVMPGYSTYLHPYDDNHLIGIGFDTKTSSWGGTINGGVKIDLYDVTDISKPKQQYSKIFGGIGSSSDVIYNPRALIWDDGRKTLLMPVQLLDQNQVTYQYTSAWQGLLAVKVDTASGITQEAKITHIDMSDIAAKRKAECAQYVPVDTTEKCYTHIVTGEKVCVKPSENPANPTVPAYCYAEFDDTSYLANQIWNFYPYFVQRGLYIGDSLYTVSPQKIQSNTYGWNYALIKSIDNK